MVSYLHPHDVPGLLALREQLAEGRSSILRARALRSDGTYRWLELNVKPIYEKGELVGRLTAYRDVHAEVEAQERLAKSERLFRMLAENATDVVAYADDGLLAWVSPSVTAALGWEPADLVGKSLIAYAHPADVTTVAEQQAIALHGMSRRRFRLRNRSGHFNWVESHAGPYRDGEGAAGGGVTSFRVVDDLVRAEEVLDRRARFDALTGLINRQEVFEQLEAEGRRTGQEIAVLFCDLDRLKEINDSFGHAAGDEVLRVVAERARMAIRRDDIAGRIGGDEFLVVLHGVHGLDEARAKAEDVRRSVSEPVALAGGCYSPSLSIGVTLAQSGEDVAALIGRADEAMYAAKRAGRGRVVQADRVLPHR
ncbi:MAG: diguanylate cyclase domain-containing protein, partial [Actinomycetota bacterium]